ncbi:MAG: ParB/RepB/Spo0J family partition protein [Clostridia bacterium]|nr:ParB/RepB/Spo0J family partition protein [Clostridia bacterium]
MLKFAKSLQNDNKSRIREISVDMIRPNPDQPRRVFDKKALMELAHSIRLHGVIQPLTVRRVSPSSFELIAGERRLQAAKLAQLDTVPCIVMELDSEESAIVALVENIQRQDLSFFEEAQAIDKLMKRYRLTQEQAAARIGRRQSTVANKVRLLRLSADVREIIIENGLSERHARALLRLPDEGKQLTALAAIIERGLNASQTEAMINQRLSAPEPARTRPVTAKKPVGLYKDARIFVNTINGALEAIERSGMLISSERSEDDDTIEFLIRMKKKLL